MDQHTIEKLNSINISFYHDVATHFSSSRSHSWEGWEKLISQGQLSFDDHLALSVLDLGCGNGRFLSFISEHFNGQLNYLGIDQSEQLLSLANQLLHTNPAYHGQATFKWGNLLDLSSLPTHRTYDLVLAFGVFHHIPGFENRVNLLKYMLSRAARNGLAILTLWDFMKLARYKEKIISWDQLKDPSISPEKGDYLMKWGRGVNATRYVHFVDDDELVSLLAAAGVKKYERFYSDGKEGIQNLYLLITP